MRSYADMLEPLSVSSEEPIIIQAVELGIKAVEELLSRTGIDPSLGAIDQVYMGQVLQAGAGQAPARQVALGCGMPNSTRALQSTRSGSSLKAVMIRHRN